ncbi:MAG: hypothetical protein PUC77_08020 [Bacteroidales bacterium]|nr:hypothetical protein [Bacteroidales bacterium]MDD6140758.1 hypothetical protein [Bacteroidales bacterium]
MTDNKISDRQIAEFLQPGKDAAPENPWFTRKVMNRLPERRKSYNWITIAINMLCIAACLFVWCYTWGNDMSRLFTLDITKTEFVKMIGMLAGSIAICTLSITQIPKYLES